MMAWANDRVRITHTAGIKDRFYGKVIDSRKNELESYGKDLSKYDELEDVETLNFYRATNYR